MSSWAMRAAPRAAFTLALVSPESSVARLATPVSCCATCVFTRASSSLLEAQKGPSPKGQVTNDTTGRKSPHANHAISPAMIQ